MTKRTGKTRRDEVSCRGGSGVDVGWGRLRRPGRGAGAHGIRTRATQASPPLRLRSGRFSFCRRHQQRNELLSGKARQCQGIDVSHGCMYNWCAFTLCFTQRHDFIAVSFRSSPSCGPSLILSEKTRACFRLPVFRCLADRRYQHLDRSTLVDKRRCSCRVGSCSRQNIVIDTQHDDSTL